MEQLARGFSLAEAPLVVDDVLAVSDVLGGGVRRFRADGTEVEPLIEDRHGIGGMGLLSDGGTVVSGRDLTIVRPDGSTEVLAEVPVGGTGFNDILVVDDSVIAGVLTSRPMAGEPLQPGALLHVERDGTATSAPVSFCWPNGIALGPGGDRLHVADYAEGVVHAGTWTGQLSGLVLEPWFTSPTGDVDGLALDDDGSFWIAGGAGGVVLHVDEHGTEVGQLDVPDDFVSSCCLWPGRSALVVTTGTGVFLHSFG
jgi:gluconolactonase